MNPLSRIDPDDPYPESDGEPMAENTLQYDWIVMIKENLERCFADHPEVFIAANLFWYPVPDRRVTGPLAPDVMVVFGRPKGTRGCYRQWDEAGIAPQVVFEVRSPSNSAKELRDKRDFYETYGVEEYYLIDPESSELEVWLRRGDRLQAMAYLNAWISPRLGVRFSRGPEELKLQHPDGEPFRSPLEVARLLMRERDRVGQERARADEVAQQLVQERARADRERARARRLAERLRALGVDPDDEDAG